MKCVGGARCEEAEVEAEVEAKVECEVEVETGGRSIDRG